MTAGMFFPVYPSNVMRPNSALVTVEIVEHVKLLREIVPDWISQTELGEKGSYLRMNREFEVSEVLKILEKQQ